MSILILSIICFILAFMPFFRTMLVTIFVGISTIILAIVYGKKQENDSKEKNKKEIPTIAIMISIMAIIISVVNFGMSMEFDEEPIDLLQIRINSFENYSMTDEAIVNNKIKIAVKDISFDGNKCLANIKITGLAEDIKISLNDFFIYNENNKEISFADDSGENVITYYSKIAKDEILEDTLIFELENIENLEEIYLVYKDDVNSVKIKL